MAEKKKYVCASCGYAVDIYEGRGLFQQEIIAMVCAECHNVENIVVGGIIGDIAPSFRSEAGRLYLRCGSDSIKRWDRLTCPKCGGRMSAEGKATFWT